MLPSLMYLGKDLRRIVSALVVILLLTSMLTYISGISAAIVTIEQGRWVHYFPLPEDVSIYHWEENDSSYVEVSIYFPTEGYIVEDWGTTNATGNNISVDAKIWRWTGITLPMIKIENNTYSLGSLSAGEYLFTFKAWEWTIKEITFINADIVVPDDYPTIQEAINAAVNGDTIIVRNGTYYENVIINKTISLVGEDKETTIIDGGELWSVVRILANDVIVQGFTIKNCRRTGGVGSEEERSCVMVKGNNTLIKNNEIAHDNISMSWYIGIYLLQSSNNIIDRNYMKDDWNAIGVLLVQSSNNTISNNNMTDNGDGIWIEDYSSNNTVYGNTITDSWFSGIIVQLYSHNNNFYENTITGTNYEGIFLSRSNYNTFSGNFIANNGLGVELATGAPFNKFYHNNFINNTQWVHDPQNLVTFWDNGCEGNYWSNYNGTDLNEDGIGDEYLPWEGVDNYPLMNPYWNPADINHDSKVDIFDVVLAAGAYLSTLSDLNWNCHCDITEPYGVIDIFDIVMICTSYGEEYTP